MKTVLIFFAMLTLILGCNTNEKNSLREIEWSDTLQTEEQFRSIVAAEMEKTEDTSRTITETEMVRMIKMYNSIGSYRLWDRQKPYGDYYDRFQQKFISKAVPMLNCELSIGGSLFCEKYRLQIGGPRYPKDGYLVIKDLE